MLISAGFDWIVHIVLNPKNGFDLLRTDRVVICAVFILCFGIEVIYLFINSAIILLVLNIVYYF